MDKAEYRMKLDEINGFVEAGDYEGPLDIVEQIDWRRVKSIRTLCMVADIYEVNGMLEESMEMLKLALKRSSSGKMVLYRQVELALKMGETDAALKYYNQYLETASNDTSKYILKYKILKAQKAPLEDQIAVLEDYREREYTERWVYELAKLYKSAGMQYKCVEACDDLILWFGEGKYVTRAMELKMTYVPLSAEQKIKYDRAKAGDKSRSARIAKQAEDLAGISAAVQRQMQTPEQKDASADGGEDTAEGSGTPGRMSQKTAAPAAEPDPVFHMEQLQERLTKSFQEVLAGFNRRTETPEAPEAEPFRMPEEAPEAEIGEYQVTDLKREENETVIKADKGDAIARRTEFGEPEEIPTRKSENREVTSIEQMDLEALFAETSSALAAAAEDMVHRTEEAKAAEEEPEADALPDEEIGEVPGVPAGEPETEMGPGAENLPDEEIGEVPGVPVGEPETEMGPGEEDLPDEDTEETEMQRRETEDAAEEAMAAFETSLFDSLHLDGASPEEDKVAEESMAAFEASLDQILAEETREPAEEAAEPEIMEEAVEAEEEPAAEPAEETAEPEVTEEAVEAEEEPAAESAEETAEPEVTEEAMEEAVEEAAAEPAEETAEPEVTEEAVEEEEEAAAEPAEETAEPEVTEEAMEEPEEEEEPAAEPAEETAEPEVTEEAEEEEEEAAAEPAEETAEPEVTEEIAEDAADGLASEMLAAAEGEFAQETQSPEGGEETAIEAEPEPAEEAEKESSLAESLATAMDTEDTAKKGSVPGGMTREILYSVEWETASPEEIEALAEAEREKDAEPAAEEAPQTEAAAAEEEKTEEAPEEPESAVEALLREAEEPSETISEVLERETPEEKRIRILNATRPDRLTKEQKQLFSYFSKVPGMDEQVLEAINAVYLHADEKTSRHGNIAVMGSKGAGKTRLTEGLVKAICRELGLEAVKYANIDGAVMNQKDPATVIGRMAGGFLLIQRASLMDQQTIEKLSQAMDFRTDSMILILEDEKKGMRRLLADNPEFADKIDTVISIPVFTNDELVTFARTYARENGYRMDEMGVLALYTLIGDNQREDEPITVGKVKEMVDGAMKRASGSKLGRKLSKRHTDAEGRILLREKDFDF